MPDTVICADKFTIMASAAHNNNGLLWVLTIAVCFLLGKTCNCHKEKVESAYYYAPAITLTDTVITNKEPARVLKPVYRQPGTRQYIRGPRGGCYYINENGNKVYVARSICN
jgi:hypothetical protein